MTRDIKKSIGWMLATSLVLLIHSFEVEGRDFGKHGTTFQIHEADMLLEIKGKLKGMEQNGILGRFNEEMEKNAYKRVINPKAVANIGHTEVVSIREFDPSYKLTEDLKDHEGRIIHKAGTVVNPLTRVSLANPLVFIDGREEGQVQWAIAQSKELQAKIVLVAGSPIELMRKHSTRFFFDQNGMIVSRLKIEHVPAIVMQSGLKLQVAEVLGAINNGTH